MEKGPDTDEVSVEHQEHTFSAASVMLAVLKGGSAIVLVVASVTLVVYGALTLWDWIAG